MGSQSSFKKPVTHAINEFLVFLHSNHPKINKIVIALSGGKDSVALLHGLSRASHNYLLKAVYINHGLQTVADEWQKENAKLCQQLSINYDSIQVEINTNKASLEQEARNARYAAFTKLMDENTCLVTAQHQDDQAETLLLQLFRGAGVKGLMAMPYIKSFANGLIARPLLSISVEDIKNYINSKNLSFVEDPTNADDSISRNFLRNQVIPKLKETWPKLQTSLAKTTENLAEAQLLIEQLAEQDLQSVLEKSHILNIEKLKSLPIERVNNLLRYWLASFNIRMPQRKQLAEIYNQFIAEENNNPLFELSNYQLRKYQSRIYLVGLSDDAIDFDKSYSWILNSDFYLNGQCRIELQQLVVQWPKLKGKEVTVHYRQGGETYYRNDKVLGKSLKNYFQERQIPTWERNKLLLVSYQGKVIFIESQS